MRRDYGIIVFLLVVGLVFGMTLGMNEALAQPLEEEDDEIMARPNPMDRPVDTSAPAMKPGSILLPAEKVGTSEPAMRPETTSGTGSASSTPGMPGATPGGPSVMVNDQDYDLTDGRRVVAVTGADGRLQLFLLQGNSKVLAPDGTYQLSDGRSITVSGGQTSMPVDPYDHGGAVRSPGQMQMPGKMR